MTNDAAQRAADQILDRLNNQHICSCSITPMHSKEIAAIIDSELAKDQVGVEVEEAWLEIRRLSDLYFSDRIGYDGYKALVLTVLLRLANKAAKEKR